MEKRIIGGMFSFDGMIHKIESGTPQKPLSESGLNWLKKNNFDKTICLNCSRKKCQGAQECFKRERQRMLNEIENTNESKMHSGNEKRNQ